MLLRKWSTGTPRERTAVALILVAATAAAWMLRPESDFGSGVVAGVRIGLAFCVLAFVLKTRRRQPVAG